MLTEAPQARAILAPVIARTFVELDVSVSLRAEEEWHEIYSMPSVHRFELELGVEARRWQHNDDGFARAERTRRTVLAEHAGFSDLFVPVFDADKHWGTLVAGPFATKRPTSVEVRQRWRWLTGTDPLPSDPRFADYLAATLHTLTLEGATFDGFKRLLECYAGILGGGSVKALAAESAELGKKLRDVRLPERMWNEARSMVDARTSHIWTTRHHADILETLGSPQVPNHAVVGLLLGREDEVDPIDDWIRRDAFQRACVTLARKSHCIAMQIGDHGVALLLNVKGSTARRQAILLDLAQKAQPVAKRFRFKLHVGIPQPSDAATLAESYAEALAAAEKALTEGASVSQARAREGRSGEARPEESRLALNHALGKVAREQPSRLAAQFERYLEATAVASGYRLEVMRARVEVGFERVVDALIQGGALDEKNLSAMLLEHERALTQALTVRELFGLYRKAVADVQIAMLHPVAARKERSTRRAIDFIRENLGEPISLAEVSRVAGFAPGYFSKLFKRQEGITLEHFIRKLRVARARDLLHNTTLPVERVGQLCGFGRRNFHLTFKEAEGMTPLEYRDRVWWSGVSAHDRAKVRHSRSKSR